MAQHTSWWSRFARPRRKSDEYLNFPPAPAPPVDRPRRPRAKRHSVPPSLQVAMATVKSGDFIFDPVNGR